MYLHSLIAQRGLTVNVPVGGGAVLKKTKKKTLWMPGVGDMTNIISVLTDISVICNMYHDNTITNHYNHINAHLCSYPIN